MIFDQQAIFSNSQAITATAASTNILDMEGSVGTPVHGNALTPDMANAHVRLAAIVDEAFAAAGAATLTIDLETDDDSAFGSATNLWSSGALGKAVLIQGYHIPIPIRLPKSCERYLRLNFTVATGPMTAGKITSGIVVQEQTNSV